MTHQAGCGEDWICGPCDAVNNNIRQRCRFCKKPRAEMGWQPIETAPKDREYLAFQPEHDMGRYALPARICLSGSGGPRKASHWMPLPEPPRTALRGDREQGEG